MEQTVSYADFEKEVSLVERHVDYDALCLKPTVDEAGHPIPLKPKRIPLNLVTVYRLLEPYISIRLWDQIKAVVPLGIYLALFLIFIMRQGVMQSGVIVGGFIAVIIGLMFFMEGIKLGLMPFAETIGRELPKRLNLFFVMIIIFLLGIGVTYAEPAIGALKAVGAGIDANRAPYLYILLNQWTQTLIISVGIGVGVAAVLGTLRFLYGMSLKPYLYVALALTLGLTLYCMLHPELRKILGLAWDCGAVTTGPVTVPIVLALGIGIASVGNKGESSSSLSGFGIVALASLFPIIAVLILGIVMAWMIPLTQAQHLIVQVAAASSAHLAWYNQTPWVEVIAGIRAIVPLVLFLWLVLQFILRRSLQQTMIVAYGLVLAVLGMIIFNLGLTYGLAKLGSQAGSLIPAAFTHIAQVKFSPIYWYVVGILITLIFAWFLGFGATLAEPALNTLGQTVENLTSGALRKKKLMYAVALGVASGLVLGMLKIIYAIPLGYLLIPGYLLAVLMTVLSTEEFVNVAWDSAGVTTGPVTVPLVLAMGIGVSLSVKAIDGFGVLSMASIGPILAVLGVGLIVRLKTHRLSKDAQK